MHKKKKILKWAMLIIWALFIFFMSNMPGDVSSEQSDVVVKVIHDLGIDVNGLFGITITFIISLASLPLIFSSILPAISINLIVFSRYSSLF